MSCQWALDDGAYLLGALSPEERHVYEEHLAGCDSCAAALREVAGLPGLLSRLPADAVEPPLPAPATLLPALLAAVGTKRARGRRRVRLGAAALVAAAAVVAAVFLVPRIGAPHPPPAASLTRLVQVPITASAALVDRSWGTEIDLKCTYTGSMEGAPASYLLVATDRTGHEQQVATWAVAARPVALTAATSLRRAQLASLEIRSPTGQPLLRLQR